MKCLILLNLLIELNVILWQLISFNLLITLATVQQPLLPRAYKGAGFLEFQETPYDSREISIITSLSIHLLILSSQRVQIQLLQLVPFRIFYTCWSLTLSLTITHSSDTIHLHFIQSMYYYNLFWFLIYFGNAFLISDK